ncbi:hypothetical protein SAZ10_02570 [Mesorhizobium sp. BAC0120]|uniref:hypothetical protein n=1 Tax=Mesorhizobium sp. BAC0120 TaxID=3090670 RepID=UPI00298CEC7B|nr:hypothetical protein [Mesorhizobium sp. BAC0120]MDW6020641.1 hypothetical protein [Mesorhizobium sp. BAC0120]
MYRTDQPALTMAEDLAAANAASCVRHQHAAIWAAIDQIAASRRISASRLSILAGRDPTAFNPSKRVKGEELRWPSTETIAKVLALAEMTYSEFGTLVDENMGDASPSSLARRARSLADHSPDDHHFQATPVQGGQTLVFVLCWNCSILCAPSSF